jgi:hypothetical protein
LRIASYVWEGVDVVGKLTDSGISFQNSENYSERNN